MDPFSLALPWLLKLEYRVAASKPRVFSLYSLKATELFAKSVFRARFGDLGGGLTSFFQAESSLAGGRLTGSGLDITGGGASLGGL